MEEKNKKEELQSRRDFFKKAAKAALPIMGAIVLANVPDLSKAMKSEMECDCSGACSGTCIGNCKGTCDGACMGTCQGSCKGNCSGGCAYTCKAYCAQGTK